MDTHTRRLLALWQPLSGWVDLRVLPEDDGPETKYSRVTLRSLLLEDVSSWKPTRLAWWASRVPRILVSALRPGADLTGLPRDKGPYTEGAIQDVCSLWVAIEAGASFGDWTTLAGWSIRGLYREWRHHRGHPHVCEARVRWLLSSGQLVPHLPPGVATVPINAKKQRSA